MRNPHRRFRQLWTNVSEVRVAGNARLFSQIGDVAAGQTVISRSEPLGVDGSGCASLSPAGVGAENGAELVSVAGVSAAARSASLAVPRGRLELEEAGCTVPKVLISNFNSDQSMAVTDRRSGCPTDGVQCQFLDRVALVLPVSRYYCQVSLSGRELPWRFPCR